MLVSVKVYEAGLVSLNAGTYVQGSEGAMGMEGGW